MRKRRDWGQLISSSGWEVGEEVRFLAYKKRWGWGKVRGKDKRAMWISWWISEPDCG
jgi:hypothetical protein